MGCGRNPCSTVGLLVAFFAIALALVCMILFFSPDFSLPNFNFATSLPSTFVPDDSYAVICAEKGHPNRSDNGFFYFDDFGNRLSRFNMKGIGYSPTPVGKLATDYYTKAYSYLYETDIPIIASMGANTIRLWEWDVNADHTQFLDLIAKYNMTVLIPYPIKPKFYPILAEEETKRNILLDFIQVVKSTKDHPAVLGYLIGNELNILYPDQMNSLFPLVNQMVDLMRQLDDDRLCPHVVLLPLAFSNFEELVKKYNEQVSFSAWAVQLYQPDMQYAFENFTQLTKNRPYPIVITEFGADAFDISSEPQNKVRMYKATGGNYPAVEKDGDKRQLNTVMGMWNQMQNYADTASIVGGCVMEFVDEWWKGDQPDMFNSSCPDTRLNEQSPCGHSLDDTFIHEEYLGIFSQNKSDGYYCLQPRSLFWNLTATWKGSGDFPFVGGTTCRYYVGLFENPFGLVYIFGVLLGFLMWYLIALSCTRDDVQQQTYPVTLQHRVLSPNEIQHISHLVTNECRRYYPPPPGGGPVDLRFHPVVMGVERRLKDALEISTANNYIGAAKILYFKTCEGLFLWRRNIDRARLNDEADMIEAIIALEIVRYHSDTIAHAPDLLSAVQDYFLSALARGNETDLIRKVQKIFKYYYDQLPEELTEEFNFNCCTLNKAEEFNFNFDDLNYVGQRLRPTNWKSVVKDIFSFRIFRVLQKSPPCGDADVKSFSKDVLLTKCFHTKHPGLFNILPILFNYTWLIRLDLWLLSTAWFFNPTVLLDGHSFTDWIAIVDSLLLVLSAIFNVVLIRRTTTELRNIVSAIWRAMMLATVLTHHFKPFPYAYWYLWYALGSFIISQICFMINHMLVRYDRGRYSSSWKVSKYRIRGVFGLVSAFFSILLTWGLFFFILIPSFTTVSGNICSCPLDGFINTPQQVKICSVPSTIACWSGVILVWVSSLIVSIITMFASYSLIMLAIGIVQGKHANIGAMNAWKDLSSPQFRDLWQAAREYYGDIKLKSIWNDVIENIYDDWQLSKDEMDRLKILIDPPNFGSPPKNSEAERRILSFCTCWYSILVNSSPLPMFSHLSHMGSLTTLIPVYDEEVLYQESFLKQESERHPIAPLRFLIESYPDEWENFCKKDLRMDPIVARNDFFSGRLQQNSILKVREWASFHGQTVYKTVRGIHNLRKAFRIIDIPVDKYQVIVSHQTYKLWQLHVDKLAQLDPNIDEEKQEIARIEKKMQEQEDLKKLARKYNFEIVCYSVTSPNEVTSDLIDKSCVISDQPLHSVPRFGTDEDFKGEGKADNQMQALTYATGSILQTVDMNQYFTLENGLFYPIALGSFFNCLKEPYIPEIRVLGFPEFTFTRSVSAVGELMGMAEFAFVTILQRMLTLLHARMHYGHPDFFDAFWVHSRGGPSKASKKVNLNEDVFAGYEIAQRGESIDYVEYIVGQKGRETDFVGATVFMNKLAKGAAQQALSKDVYCLNESTTIWYRFNLFFGTLGYYVSSYLMDLSVTSYMYSILFLAVGGVSYHQLGLLGTALAVPWLIQIGFVQMFPVLVELILENGWLSGLIHFILYIPGAVVFFLFQLRTTANGFISSLLNQSSASYSKTGRLLGIERRSLKDTIKSFQESHFAPALMLLYGIICYFLIATEDLGTKFVRILSILLLVFSWLIAPVVFNPFPSLKLLHLDYDELTKWMRTPFPMPFDITLLCKYNDNNKTVRKKNNKKRIENLVTKKNTSWEAMFWITSLQDVPMNTFWNRFVWSISCITEWFIFSMPMYFMVVLALLNYYDFETIQLVLYVIGLYLLIIKCKEDLRGSSKGLLMGALSVAILGGIVFWLLVIRTNPLSVFFTSLLFDGVLIFILVDWIRAYIFLKLARKMAKANPPNVQLLDKDTCTNMIYSSQPPKLNVLIIMAILYITEVLTILMGVFHTAILFCSNVSYLWQRLTLK